MPPLMLPVRSASWMSRGQCRPADPELFFPIATAQGPAARQVEAAKAVCAACAVCLSYALEIMPDGVWGGTTFEERRAARGRLDRRQAKASALETVSAAMTGDDASDAAPVSGQRFAPGRTA